MSNPKPDLHNINANTKFGENRMIFTQVIVWKQKYEQTYDRPMGNQCDTIVPRNYRVAGYKNTNEVTKERPQPKSTTFPIHQMRKR